MCTVLIGIDPAAQVPVLLVFARDEQAGRPWLPPARHWPAHPALLGGLDLQAGGTWLAVRPGPQPRVACLLNGFGRPADPAGRRSRGDLPPAAADAPDGLWRDPLPNEAELAYYDPFHLLLADPSGVRLLSWDGRRRVGPRELGPGTHVIANFGLDEEPAEAAGVVDAPETPRTARETIDARTAFFRPLLAAAPRPEPRLGRDAPGTADPTGSAWGTWLDLADGAGLDPADARAMISRRAHRAEHRAHEEQGRGEQGRGEQGRGEQGRSEQEHGHAEHGHEHGGHERGGLQKQGRYNDRHGHEQEGGGRETALDTGDPAVHVWATTSVSMLALGPEGLRFDFNPTPGQRAGWRRIDAD